MLGSVGGQKMMGSVGVVLGSVGGREMMGRGRCSAGYCRRERNDG